MVSAWSRPGVIPLGTTVALEMQESVLCTRATKASTACSGVLPAKGDEQDQVGEFSPFWGAIVRRDFTGVKTRQKFLTGHVRNALRFAIEQRALLFR